MWNPFDLFWWRRNRTHFLAWGFALLMMAGLGYAALVLLLGVTWFGEDLSDDGRQKAAAIINILTAFAVVFFTFVLTKIEAARERVAFSLKQLVGVASAAPERRLRVWTRIDNIGGRPVSFPAARCHLSISDKTGRTVRIEAHDLQFVGEHKSDVPIPTIFGCLAVPPGEFRFARATFPLKDDHLVATAFFELQATAGKMEEVEFESSTA